MSSDPRLVHCTDGSWLAVLDGNPFLCGAFGATEEQALVALSDAMARRAKPPMANCVCCGTDIGPDERVYVHEHWGGRMDAYCERCSDERCDAYPQRHPARAREVTPDEQ